MELVPIEITIGLKPDGSALYPDFNTLASVIASGEDWSVFIDSNGPGWLYDRCGHKEDEPGSPFGTQRGMLLVPAAFATEAVAAFSPTVELKTESQTQTFYNTKHGRDIEDEEIDNRIVQRIRHKQDLGQTLTARQLQAIDPTDNTRGIRANPRKNWATFKADKGITIAP